MFISNGPVEQTVSKESIPQPKMVDWRLRNKPGEVEGEDIVRFKCLRLRP